MKTVTIINLNGRAYQVDEGAHKLLSDYLAKADGALRDNPDKDEILADFEQAIAEKCVKYLNPNKNVISEREIETIIREMGPVDGSADAGEAPHAEATGEKNSSAENASVPKRLYRIKEGAMIAGVCTGLAAYFDMDVVLVRVAFVIVTLVSHGFGILAYIVMVLIIPKAGTEEQRAHAQGFAFTAHEFIERAKKEYAEYKDDGGREWKRHWREQKRQWKHQAKKAAYETADWHSNSTAKTWLAVINPIIGIIIAFITIVWILAIASLITVGAVFGWVLPVSIPIWIGVIILICLYNIVIWPLRIARYPEFYKGNYDAEDHGWFGIWEAAMWMGLFVILGWVGYHHSIYVHDHANQLGNWITSHILRRFK